jgi:hypothetical protein
VNKLFAAFFAFGATMCSLTIILLIFPGTSMDSAWRLNPDAHLAFQSLGKASVLLMFIVGTTCAFAAVGIWRSQWGTRLAVAVLSVNILGDLFGALVRHDLRTLIGLPIGGAMIVYLIRSRKKRFAASSPD